MSERVTFGIAPWHQPAGQSIDRRRSHHDKSRNDKHDGPRTMLWIGNGIREVTIAGHFVDLLHRRFNKPFAALLARVGMSQFDNAEQLIAQPRKTVTQQFGHVFQPTLTPDPAVPLQRQKQPGSGRTGNQQDGSQRRRCVHEAVKDEDPHVRQHQSEHRRKDALGDLHNPDTLAEFLQPRLRAFGQLQLPHSLTHTH